MFEIKRALISVYDKTNLKEFSERLSALGIEIFSTGGTSKTLKNYGLAVKEISDYTGYPEMFDGRVKTLHPKIHGGILALRQKDGHIQQAKEENILLFDMIVVNLYPFEEISRRENAPLSEVLENIDIGGPTMLRAAAKNFQSVAAVASPEFYDKIASELEKNNSFLSINTSKFLSKETFKIISQYDGNIFKYLSKDTAEKKNLPENIFLELSKVKKLRYGENPHQKAALYKTLSSCEIPYLNKLHGKEISFNNIVDLDTAFRSSIFFKEPAVSIVKHNNPCGIASCGNLSEAFRQAYLCDEISAFGSVIGLNREVDFKTAELISCKFIECVIAPGFSSQAKNILTKKKNIRLIAYGSFSCADDNMDFKKITGGFLVQEPDTGNLSPRQIKVVTKKKPTDEEMKSMLFSWDVIRFMTSNAIVLSEGTSTVGIGMGQPSRVGAVKIAVEKSGNKSRHAVMASDAFFPMPDSIDVAAEAGIKAVIQPGGSIKDREVIEAADKRGIAMVFTGIRHFRH